MPASFEIKSANLPLLALRLATGDLAAVHAEWERQYAELPDFFDQEPLVIDLSVVPEAEPPLDFAALLDLLRRYRVQPLAYKGGTPAWASAAQAAGLVAASDTALLRPLPEPTPPPVHAEPQPEALPEPSAAPLPPQVLDKPLRSGQRYYAKGRDLVVLAPVSSGAEVIADGHLYFYAPLRGRAAAGASGDTEARIFVPRLEAELLSIAGHYRTAEQLRDTTGWGHTCQVRLLAEADGYKMLAERAGR